MSANDKLDIYLEGWRLGDPTLSLRGVAPGFCYDDPATGLIRADGFVRFVEDFKSAAAALNGAIVPSPFLTYRHVVTDTAVTPHTAWCWWQAGETTLQGAALITFDDTGVLFERLAYYADVSG